MTKIPLFLHIPKTGGKTLTQHIYKQYRTDDYYEAEKGVFVQGVFYYPAGIVNNHALAIPENILRTLGRPDVRTVVGHYSFGIHRYLNKPWTYVTLHRNPIDRVVSLYYHFRKWDNDELHAQIVSNNVSLDDFVLKLNRREADNDQTRRISGLEPPFGKCSIDTLETAKANLRKYFSAIGTTERFYETLVLFKRTLAWSCIPYFVPDNVNKSRPATASLPQKSIDSIVARNELDLQLYDFATNMLDELISFQNDDFYEEVENFKTLNEEYITQNSLPRW